MLVRSTKYPNILAVVKGKSYQFKDSFCEIPEEDAYNLTQINPDYEIAEMTNADKEAMVKWPAFDPNTWQPDYKRIVWDGPIGFNNGYGKASMMIIEALDKQVDLRVINARWIGSTDLHISPNLERILNKPLENTNAYHIKFFPGYELTRKIAERFIGYTMLEATRIPQAWVDILNKYCERVIVPCEQQKQAFVDSGVKRDIAIIPLGILPELFPIPDRTRTDDTFMFGTMGTLTYRKGTDILVEAFKRAFPKSEYPNVGLFIKTLAQGNITNMWFMKTADLIEDDRIQLVTDAYSPTELVDYFFKEIDCFVFPTRGEGFGLPPLEAMATGLPVICTPFSGCADFINESVAYPIDYKLVDVPNGTAGGYPKDLQAEGQQWAEPDVESVIAHMRFVYENREKAKKKGLKAAKFVRENFTAEHTARKLVEYLDSKF